MVFIILLVDKCCTVKIISNERNYSSSEPLIGTGSTKVSDQKFELHGKILPPKLTRTLKFKILHENSMNIILSKSHYEPDFVC